MINFPSFDDFHTAATGFTPFPWQSRLAAQLQNAGQWPADIGVPTGLGKTTCLHIAVWHLASHAGKSPAQSPPRRIWYVVNRRLLVDAAYERALELQGQLNKAEVENDQGPLGVVARQLRKLQAIRWDCGVLHIARLRGGADRGHRPPDPSCPALILATVSMFGSRLLFRGYGTSPGLRPIDAALAGTDALVLLDEAHLALPLQRSLRQLGEFPPAGESILPPQRLTPQLVNLTATGRSGPAFTIDDDDRAHPIVATRLNAAKPTSLSEVSDKSMPAELAKTSLDLVDSARSEIGREVSAVIFVNTAKRAPEVAKHVVKLASKRDASITTRVLTGRMRPADAAELRDSLTAGEWSVAAGREASQQPATSQIIIATQTLEVGADFDFDVLVSESAGARAITQRLGRLNRLGQRPWAQAAILHAHDKADSWLYGTEPGSVFESLVSHADRTDGGFTVDLGPGVIAERVGPTADEEVFAPELLPNHLAEWVKTSKPIRREPPVEPFISGQSESDRTVTVVWRAVLPVGRSRLRPLVHTDESVEIPVWEVTEALNKRGDATVCQLDDDGICQIVSIGNLRPGDRIILASSVGLYQAATGWDPNSSVDVDDLSSELRAEIVLTGERLKQLRHSAQLARLDIPDDAWHALVSSADVRQREWSGEAWVGKPVEGVAGSGEDLVDVFEALRFVDVHEGPTVVRLPVDPQAREPKPRVDAFDELSLADGVHSQRATLSAHSTNVGQKARAIAEALGLEEHYIDLLDRAGRFHDLGKADPRFQLLLGADIDTLMAKSVQGGHNSVRLWPKGARHEALSGVIAQAWLTKNPVEVADGDLLLHAVLSHHGWGRPLVPGVPGANPISFAVDVDGQSFMIDAELESTDWDQPARFARLTQRFGPWGLALLETVLRQADHAESAQASAGTFSTLEVL